MRDGRDSDETETLNKGHAYGTYTANDPSIASGYQTPAVPLLLHTDHEHCRVGLVAKYADEHSSWPPMLGEVSFPRRSDNEPMCRKWHLSLLISFRFGVSLWEARPRLSMEGCRSSVRICVEGCLVVFWLGLGLSGVVFAAVNRLQHLGKELRWQEDRDRGGCT